MFSLYCSVEQWKFVSYLGDYHFQSAIAIGGIDSLRFEST